MDALRAFENSAGGRDDLLVALMQAPELSEDQVMLMRLMGDPARSRDSLAALCHQVGIMPSELLEWFRQASFAQATTAMMRRLPRVVEDVNVKALDHFVTCPVCQGDAAIGEEKCLNCNGKGKIARPSDFDRQRLLFEASGMIKKAQGVQVNVQQNMKVGDVGGTFAKLVKAADEAAYAVEGEIIGGENAVLSEKD